MSHKIEQLIVLSVPHEKPNPVQKPYVASYGRKSAPYVRPRRRVDHEESGSFEPVFKEPHLSRRQVSGAIRSYFQHE